MEEECLMNECDRSVNGGVDRLSQLPDEILFVILSFLHYKEGAATTVLSSRWFDLWKHNPHLKFDRISLLPNQIVAVILSFLSLKEAATTSVLSSRWSNAWKHTPNLDFDPYIIPKFNYSDYYHFYNVNAYVLLNEFKVKFIETVTSVIQSHKAPLLKKFRLCYSLHGKIAKCVVTKWLEFVFSRRVESLYLKFNDDEGNFHVLEELLRESRICLQPQTDLIFFQSLKSLHLKGLIVSGEDIELFLSDCPLLEQLTIGLTLTSDVEVCGETLMLKLLVIYSCKGEKSVKVSAPNLIAMRFYVNDRGGVKLMLENAPKLVHADIITYPEKFPEQRFACTASCDFSQLQFLRLSCYESKMSLENYFTQAPKLKNLFLRYPTFDESLLLPVVTSIIWAYPRLEDFTLRFSDVREECMQVSTDIGRSLHEHLQVFELEMSDKQNVTDDTAKLVIYISNNCVALRKIRILRKPYDDADRNHLRQRLQGKVPNHIQLELLV